VILSHPTEPRLCPVDDSGRLPKHSAHRLHHLVSRIEIQVGGPSDNGDVGTQVLLAQLADDLVTARRAHGRQEFEVSFRRQV
jgi:hypothetical protein